MKNGKRILALLLVLAMLTAMFSACGAGSGAGQEDTAPNVTEQATTPAADSAGDTTPEKKPVEVTVGSAMAWETLTPFRTMRVWSIIYGRMLYDSLAFITADGTLNPVVAKSWEVEEDGVTWNVEIYDYVTDSAGNHITADDIVWMIEESKKQAMKPCFNSVASVEKTGDYSLKIVMTSDVYGGFNTLMHNTYVVSRAAFEADPDGFNTTVVSTSPYKVTEFVSGYNIVLEKRDDYWQKEELIPAAMANNVDKFTVLYIAEASQSQIALETGEIDGFIALTQSLLPALDPNTISSYNVPSMVGTFLRFSGDESRITARDENLRKAIAHAIDVGALIQGVYGGLADPMHGPEPSGIDGFQDAWNNEDNYSYNVELAKEYLAKSSYNGETLELLASSSTANDRIGAILQSYLAEVGINLKLNIVERALYTADTYNGAAWDMIIVSSGGLDLPSLWTTSYDITAFPNGDAASRKDAELDALVRKAWTNAGYTDENIQAVHDYLMEHMYDYGMVQPYQCDVYNQNLGITKEVPLLGGALDFIACEYGNYSK